MRSAAGFHSRMRVSGPNSASASGEESISACSRSSCCLVAEMSLADDDMAHQAARRVRHAQILSRVARQDCPAEV